MELGNLVLGIDHVGVAVADVDDAVQLYSALFGLHEVHREINEDQGVVEVMLAAADDGRPPLQLLEPLTPDTPIAVFLDRRGPGLQQLAYRVSDIVRVAELLHDQGIRLLYDVPRPGSAGSMINFVHPRDAGGVLIEVVQPAAAAPPGKNA